MKWAGVLVVIVAISYFIFNNETWIAFYYPDASNLIPYERSPELKSYEACVDWVNNKAAMSGSTNYDWECGRDCTYSASSDIYRCKETRQ